MTYEQLGRNAALRKKTLRIITYTFLTLWAVLVLFPFYWMLLSSVKSYSLYSSEAVPSLYTLAPTLEKRWRWAAIC